MSVSYDIKKTIMDSQYRNVCCRRAMLNGVLASKASLGEGKRVYITLEKEEQVSFLSGLVHEFYGKELISEISSRGGRGKKVYFESKSANAYVAGLDDAKSLYNEKCQGCTASFLRGVFFATGRFSDPAKQFCLEFSLGNRILRLSEVFNELGLEMKNVARRAENILYTKNSSVIEDFFATADLNDTAYEIMNIKIRNEFLNNANRIRNFDTVNISKAVDAAAPLLMIIQELESHKLLGMLPEELADTAKMRLEYPDLSLSQLARLSVPPISKSGITHRMSKIMKLGRELLVKYNLVEN